MPTLVRPQHKVTARSSQARPGRWRWFRLALLAATVGIFVVAVLEHPTPLVLALGVVPIAWIFIEAIWHLSPDEVRNEDEQ